MAQFRNVIKHGPSTLIVSLPSKWVKAHDVKNGDSLEVKEDGNNIIFSLKQDKSVKKIVEVDFSGLDRSSVMFYLRSLYRQGYDIVKIRFKDALIPYFRIGRAVNIVNVIKQEVNRLPGFEIIEQRQDYCLIHVITEMNGAEFENVFKKIFFMVDDAFEGISESLREKNSLYSRSFDEKHNSITKFISYCCRLLMTEKIQGYQNNLQLYNILTDFDVVADTLKNFCRELYKLKRTRFHKDFIRLFDVLKGMQKLFYRLFFNFKKDYLVEFERSKEMLFKGLFASKMPSPQKRILASLLAISDIQRDLIESRLIIAN
ncbi:hypothetical protein DRJ25_02435 [Candidatus Woesearchaeota archaeon]|nr:MAG: hypothetical protein DRJ25_02435 [Candidatus Woesearchaeota archaeon]